MSRIDGMDVCAYVIIAFVVVMAILPVALGVFVAADWPRRH